MTLAFRMQVWDHLLQNKLDGYIKHTQKVWNKVYPTLELFQNTERYMAQFKSVNHTTCCKFNFLGIFRETIRVNQMFVRGYLPVLTEERRKRSLPFFWDDSVLSDEIGRLMVTNCIRGPFTLDDLKIPCT